MKIKIKKNADKQRKPHIYLEMNKLVFVSYFKNTIEFQETDRKKKLFIFDLNRSLYTSHCLFNGKMN